MVKKNNNKLLAKEKECISYDISTFFLEIK